MGQLHFPLASGADRVLRIYSSNLCPAHLSHGGEAAEHTEVITQLEVEAIHTDVQRAEAEEINK